MKNILYVFFSLLFFSCNNEKKITSQSLPEGDTLEVSYAKGFSIVQYDGFKMLYVTNPWPKANKNFNYLLVEDTTKVPAGVTFDHKIYVPVEKIVVTSTTHLPSLEALEELSSLIGFPGLQYVSSPNVRNLIEETRIVELGKNEAINTEVLINLKPELVVGFAVNGNNKTFNTLQKMGTAVIYNGDWTEESPLAKAEWIKFFGALYNKSEEAQYLFEQVETSYKEAKALAATTTNTPTVLSGSMYKDQWYVPYGNSWSAQFIKDANANYVYENSIGSGSMALAFESVLSDAREADFWIAPGQFKSFQQLNETSTHYNEFEAVKNKNVYTYSNTAGETGGVLYYELAPNRPDMVLKDLISIFHPQLLPEYKPVFFKPLE